MPVYCIFLSVWTEQIDSRTKAQQWNGKINGKLIMYWGIGAG